jgi:hypothetical protein
MTLLSVQGTYNRPGSGPFFFRKCENHVSVFTKCLIFVSVGIPVKKIFSFARICMGLAQQSGHIYKRDVRASPRWNFNVTSPNSNIYTPTPLCTLGIKPNQNIPCIHWNCTNMFDSCWERTDHNSALSQISSKIEIYDYRNQTAVTISVSLTSLSLSFLNYGTQSSLFIIFVFPSYIALILVLSLEGQNLIFCYFIWSDLTFSDFCGLSFDA